MEIAFVLASVRLFLGDLDIHFIINATTNVLPVLI